MLSPNPPKRSISEVGAKRRAVMEASMPTKPKRIPEGRRNRPVWVSDKIEQSTISDLKPYANNVRNHTEMSIGRLADAILEFGFVVPVIIGSDKTVITGHGRIEAANRLGLTTIPTICADHLTPAQVKAYRIADNRLAELSDWNEDALRIEFGDLMELSLAGELDFSLDITGFEIPEIDIIIAGTSDEAADPAETVAMPDPAKTCVTQQGDLWVLGEHRILCEDSLNAESYARVLDGETCRMVFTDPPYNVPVNGHVRSGNGGAHREFTMASGEMTDAEFRAFLKSCIAHFAASLPTGGIVMICMDWRHIEELISTGKACGLEFINLCVWNKTNGGMGSLYRSKHELVAIFKKPGAAHINNVALGKHGRNRTNVWDYAGVNTSFGPGGRLVTYGFGSGGSGWAGRSFVASVHDKTRPLQVLSQQPRDHPPGGHDVCAISTFASQCRGPSTRARDRHQPRNCPLLVE